MEKEIAQIKSKYPRAFAFRYKGKIVNMGQAEDVLLIPEGRGYLKGAEKLRYKKGREQFRFMYWVKSPDKKWRWGQFNVCMDKDAFTELIKQMKEKGWI
ncbi:MAG: hypothetical protein ABH874_06660 [Methanobacteriota archaeon]